MLSKDGSPLHSHVRPEPISCLARLLRVSGLCVPWRLMRRHLPLPPGPFILQWTQAAKVPNCVVLPAGPSVLGVRPVRWDIPPAGSPGLNPRGHLISSSMPMRRGRKLPLSGSRGWGLEGKKAITGDASRRHQFYFFSWEKKFCRKTTSHWLKEANNFCREKRGWMTQLTCTIFQLLGKLQAFFPTLPCFPISSPPSPAMSAPGVLPSWGDRISDTSQDLLPPAQYSGSVPSRKITRGAPHTSTPAGG